MSNKILVHDYDFDGSHKTFEYEGEGVDAQLHTTGALVILEQVPNLEAADGTTKAKLLAIHKCWDYAEVV